MLTSLLGDLSSNRPTRDTNNVRYVLYASFFLKLSQYLCKDAYNRIQQEKKNLAVLRL